MKKLYFSILVFSLLFIKTEMIQAASMDIDYLDIRIGSFNIHESLELSSEVGFVLSKKDDKLHTTSIENNNIFIAYGDNRNLNVLDSSGNLIRTIPADGSFILKGEFYGGEITQVKKDKYRDYISFILKNDTILIINHVKVKHYLYGVLPREIGSSFSYEAMKAQAIASKNFAFSNIGKHKNDGFHLCNSTCCQVYGGYDGENKILNRAIDETIDIFLTYDGKLISTYYHSNSGGHTESVEDVWGGGAPYLRAVEDEFSLNTPYSTWEIELSPLDIKEKLAKNDINIGDILDIEILEKSSGGRITECRIKGSRGEEILTGGKLRSILGNTSFKSTSFEIQKTGLQNDNYVYVLSKNSNLPKKINLNNAYILEAGKSDSSNRSSIKRMVSKDESKDIGEVTREALTFKFNGKGYGHGVGMSQWGANEMAKEGYNFREILSHYYKDIDFVDINKN